ncbi:hypothetical protein NQ318_011151, partial [Aromia moschata]
MRQRITLAFREIKPEMMINVRHSFQKRLHMCINQNGGNFEQSFALCGRKMKIPQTNKVTSNCTSSNLAVRRDQPLTNVDGNITKIVQNKFEKRRRETVQVSQ